MKFLKALAIACSWLLLSASLSLAHPGHEHAANLRHWKSADGTIDIPATFVLARDGVVQLLKENGETVSMPLSQLSQADRIWVRNRLDAIQRLNALRSAAQAAEAERPEAEPKPSHAGATGIMVGGLAVLLGATGCLLRFASSRRLSIGLGAACLIGTLSLIASEADDKAPPAIVKHFEPFKGKIQYRYDNDYLYVESNGMPDHRMMVGITAWQQQVPIPQAYTGNNAWRIPLHPRFAAKPVSAKNELFRGAIALAVNGVPIFNPIKNDGRTDTLLAGELDEFGGHCGRADDYHYHVGPVHLEKVVGKGNPIGYALDGYPLFGYTDSEGKEPKNLDEFNGRMEKDGYRYYSTKKYPYINGGMRGVVTVRDDQIDPQPKANSPRPALPPLRGAKIVDFSLEESTKTGVLKYTLQGKTNTVKYAPNPDGGYTFTFIDGNGKETTETYRGRRQEGKGGGGGKNDKQPPKNKDGKQQKGKGDPPPRNESAIKPQTGTFRLSSPAFEHGGMYPVEFTGDGSGISPPLSWTGAPEGTKAFALSLWHVPGDGEVKSYWVIYNIPANVTSLPKNASGIGTKGYNDKNRTDYDPMNSKGPGMKDYHITMYALSAEPKFSGSKVTRADLLSAIKGITLAESTLSYRYERKGGGDPPGKGKGKGGEEE